MLRYISCLAALLFLTQFTGSDFAAAHDHSHRHAHSYHEGGYDHHEIPSQSASLSSILIPLEKLTTLEKVLLISVLTLMGMILWQMWASKKTAPATPAAPPPAEEKKEEKAEEKPAAPPPAKTSSFSTFEIAICAMAGIIIILLAMILYRLGGY